MAERGRRRSRGLVALAAAATSLLSCSDAPGPDAPVLACADPDDCRLHEAAALSNVRFGFHDENGPGDADAALAAREGNATTNHGVSWAAFEPQRDVLTASMDANCAFADEHDLFQIGFHFAWQQALLDDFPDWAFELTDADELRSVLRERVRRIFDRCPGLDRIDVLNEPLDPLVGTTLHQNHFYDVLGPGYIAELLQIVRDEAPADVELFINENFTEYDTARADAFVSLVRDLVESGAPLDVVGLQTHLILVHGAFAQTPDFALMRRTMNEIGDLGLKVFVSELDVPVPPGTPDRATLQAERYARVVETCLAVPACDTIIVWGIDDDHTWLDSFDLLSGPEPEPLLFDGALERKPAYFAVRDALLRGRGGDHPLSVDRLVIERDGAASTVTITSTDPRSVSPTPGSRNDPSQAESGPVVVEVIPVGGSTRSSLLEEPTDWRVSADNARYVGASGSIGFEEGVGAELTLHDVAITPNHARQGVRILVTSGSLRLCFEAPASTIREVDGARLVATGTERPASCE